jgi:hypothetical protein
MAASLESRRRTVSAPETSPGRRHILIVGPSKTGTTGLYASVKRAMQQSGYDLQSVFEPAGRGVLDNLFTLAPELSVLVKTTMGDVRKTVPDPLLFDRRVMTVRDPRDVLVSSLLFRPLTVAALRRTDDLAIEHFVAGLERKEADPSSISLRELFELASDVGIGSPPFRGMADNLGRQRDFLERHPAHLMHYERFVRSELDELSQYVGFPVENVDARGSSMFGHISRSQSSGEFVQWLRPDDLAYFNDLFGDFLDAFGYPRDVELPAEPHIDPSTGSEYVRSRYYARRETLANAAVARETRWRPTDVTTEEQLAALRDFGSDGDPMACIRVAEVIVSGHLVPRDDMEAMRWARAAARLGLPAAMKLTADLLTGVAGEDNELHRELRRWRLQYRVRSAHRAKADIAQITRLEAELASVQGSPRLRVANHLADAARNPRRNGRAALRGLSSLWREHREARRRDDSPRPVPDSVQTPVPPAKVAEPVEG